MKGYHNNPGATAEAMRGGWFRRATSASSIPTDISVVDRKKD